MIILLKGWPGGFLKEVILGCRVQNRSILNLVDRIRQLLSVIVADSVLQAVEVTQFPEPGQAMLKMITQAATASLVGGDDLIEEGPAEVEKGGQVLGRVPY